MPVENSEARRVWLENYIKDHGLEAFSEKLRAPESFVQALLDGKRTFTDALVSQIESRLGLPEGTIDSHKA
jgi:hypothetical protein